MDREKTALLIIDMQVAMFSSEGILPFNGELVLGNIKKLLNKFRENKMHVIYVQHTKDKEYEKGTLTWQICPEIKPQDGEPVIEKGFCDSFLNTNLSKTLEDLKITNLVITGMQTEFCMDTTIRRAFSLGFNNILIKDAHSTFDSEVLPSYKIVEHHNNIISGRFAELKTTEEVLKIL